MKPTLEAALRASIERLRADCDAQEARFARYCAALGAEIGRRQRAEGERDRTVAALVELTRIVKDRFEGLEIVALVPGELRRVVVEADAAIEAVTKGGSTP